MIDPVALTRELLAVPSPTGDEARIATLVADRLESAGWQVVRQPVSGDRFNVYAHHGAPVVVLSTHLDTVPPALPYHEDDTTLYGRGACDAKGIVAAMVAAAEVLLDAGERRIGLLFVVGEEDGSDGARAAATLGPKGRYLVNGEPTEGLLVTAQKGTLKVLVEARGRAAHSGYPHLGESAIELLLDALTRIRQLALPVDEVLGPATINIGVIEGGVAPNVIAPSARAVLYVRTVGPDGDLRTAIAAAAGPTVRVDFVPGIPPASAPALQGWPSTTVAFASDLAYHGTWGTCYQIGPGTIHLAHTDHEQITKQELRTGVDTYVRLVRELLAAER
jgi:acetylornithine deacetylase